MGANPLFVARVGTLLHWANTAPGCTHDRDGFYRLKQAVCERFGRRDGEDIQQIKRDCWDCGGTGRDWIEEDWCCRCGGDGVYEWVYVRLERWRVGRHVFHRPVGRVHNLAEQRQVTVHGLIKHRDSPLAMVAAIALAKLFNRSLYWKWLRYSHPVGFGSRVARSTRLAEMVGKTHWAGWRLEFSHHLFELELPPAEERF